ncbi:MAG: hypothetical protein VYA53_02290 [Acidobacteriota bacterium]|nr:hypothetical protein [Acidobacteriota bacterium]
MTCKEVERLLTENISRGQDFQVQQHIRRCSVCKKFYHDLDSMSELSHLLGKMDKAPTGFSSSVHQRLAQQPYLGWLHWRVAPVLCLLILGLTSLLWIREAQFTRKGEILISEEMFQETPFVRVGDGDLQLIDGDAVPNPYVDVILESPSEDEYILRLPSRIKIRTNDLNHEIYLNNTSY